MPNVMHAPCFFAGFDQTRACLFVSRQQKMRQARHRMSNHVVSIAHDAIARAVMRRRDVHVSSAERERHRFFAIRGNEQPVGPELVDNMSQHLQLRCRSFESCRVTIRVDQVLDARDDRKSICFDLFDCMTMPWRQVCAGHYQLKLQLGMIDNRAQDCSLQEILGANRSDAKHASSSHTLSSASQLPAARISSAALSGWLSRRSSVDRPWTKSPCACRYEKWWFQRCTRTSQPMRLKSSVCR